ncbi:MAG: four helix bundle protein [Anaerohalosphaeraceae bacterium]
MVENCGRSQVYRKAYEFAIQVVLTTRAVRERTKEYLLFRQLLRSGTSIGANIAEANGAVSSADFSNKISIAYKETLETKYWLDVLMDCGILEKKFYTTLYPRADEIGKMLYAILKKTRFSESFEH